MRKAWTEDCNNLLTRHQIDVPSDDRVQLDPRPLRVQDAEVPEDDRRIPTTKLFGKETRELRAGRPGPRARYNAAVAEIREMQAARRDWPGRELRELACDLEHAEQLRLEGMGRGLATQEAPFVDQERMRREHRAWAEAAGLTDRGRRALESRVRALTPAQRGDLLLHLQGKSPSVPLLRIPAVHMVALVVDQSIREGMKVAHALETARSRSDRGR
jgi:hypothetical protein